MTLLIITLSSLSSHPFLFFLLPQHMTNPVYNIRREKVERALRFFYHAGPASHEALLR